MKTLATASFALFVSLLSVAIGRADNAIYVGTEVRSVTQEGQGGRTTTKNYYIVELSTARAVQIIFYQQKDGQFRTRNYTVGPVLDVRLVEVTKSSPRPTTFLVLGRVATTENYQDTTGTLLESYFFKGKNQSVDIGGTTTMLPKTLSGRGRYLFTGGEIPEQGPVPPADGELMSTLKLDLVLSKASNMSNGGEGENLDAAVSRVKAKLENDGYTEL
jgi:hypothetical protein